MATPLILASGSETRAQLLANARIDFEVLPARVDESALRAGLDAEKASPRDVSDVLAEYKARKVGGKRPEALVLGCDQIAALKGEIMTKPETPEAACNQLAKLSGQTHHLMSAAVIYHENEPIWRHVGVVRMTMRDLSTSYIDSYVDRNWESVRHSVGAYKLEEEGVRLFTQINGSYFNVLGLPLTELISYLIIRGDLES
ncbi:nucleoside triphosphate pyrophosphatase [Maritimibacter sp. UBA3975]|uniref:Maf family protein n=1 Tax=Maritimibacter sp. UBA3975 TaxID=1946833 RepID=UPI000C092F16|nr:nucleoside triphosphate pyrophosphatase [Maritimibacter sp. UBA3975]MAM63441.1 septum formation protein Maf [Maritimibacter sp.]|tara:strand:- start:35323 stop:35922 length:600 start_codon:yes stop_codon:yes gene_type:complete